MIDRSGMDLRRTLRRNLGMAGVGRVRRPGDREQERIAEVSVRTRSRREIVASARARRTQTQLGRAALRRMLAVGAVPRVLRMRMRGLGRVGRPSNPVASGSASLRARRRPRAAEAEQQQKRHEAA